MGEDDAFEMASRLGRLEHGSTDQGSRAHGDDTGHRDASKRGRSGVLARRGGGVGRTGSRARLGAGSAALAGSQRGDAGLGHSRGGAGGGALADLDLDVAGSDNLTEAAVGVAVVVLELEALDGRVGGGGSGSSKVVELLEDELHVAVRAIVGGGERSTVSDTGGGLVLELTAGGIDGKVVAEVVAEDLGGGVLTGNACVEESDGEALVVAKDGGAGSGGGLAADAEAGSRLDLSHGEPVAEVGDVDVAEGDVEDALDVEPRSGDGDGGQIGRREGELDLGNLVVRGVAALGRDGRAHSQEGGGEERSLGESHFGQRETEQKLANEKRLLRNDDGGKEELNRKVGRRNQVGLLSLLTLDRLSRMQKRRLICWLNGSLVCTAVH